MMNKNRTMDEITSQKDITILTFPQNGNLCARIADELLGNAAYSDRIRSIQYIMHIDTVEPNLTSEKLQITYVYDFKKLKMMIANNVYAGEKTDVLVYGLEGNLFEWAEQFVEGGTCFLFTRVSRDDCMQLYGRGRCLYGGADYCIVDDSERITPKTHRAFIMNKDGVISTCNTKDEIAVAVAQLIMRETEN